MWCGRRGGQRPAEAIQVAGLGRIVLLGAVVATVAGIAGLRAQTQLADPKDAPKIFASTCSACHKSPQGLAKSGQVAGFLRQHYTTGPEMSAAMAAYLVAAGSAPAANKKGAATAENAAPARIKGKKGEQLAANPLAALCFHWKSLRRSVRIEGTVEPVTAASKLSPPWRCASRESRVPAGLRRANSRTADMARV